VQRRDGQALKDAGIEFNCSFIFGGQIRVAMRLFHVYSAGNFIEASRRTRTSDRRGKYGKPIVER